MATVNGSSRHSLLPPKCPFPSISPSFVDYLPSPVLGPRGFPNPREKNSHHIRNASENFLMEEQPSWLDELLNEPDIPVHKGSHRRASSDSFTFIDIANVSKLEYTSRDNFKNINLVSGPSWGSLDLDIQNSEQYAPFYTESNSFMKPKNQAWGPSLNHVGQSPPKETNSFRSTVTEKLDQLESESQDSKSASERKDFSDAISCSSEANAKHAKQQFAQRSRVRKLQYIAELERTVQVLQAEGREVTAQLEFIHQQNLILNMENKALKQHLDSLAQEHLIKHLEHEVLEREIARLQFLFQQQQLPSPSSLGRTSSKDLGSQFANLSLKHKGPISGPLKS